MSTPDNDALVVVEELRKEYRTSRLADPFVAVDDVSFDVRTGETLAVVGESGSGKTTLTRLLLRLMEPTSGSVCFDGQDLSTVSGEQLRALRRHMQIVFQDPYSSMNPRMRVHDIVAEPLITHEPEKFRSRDAARQKVGELLEAVGLDQDAQKRYPHEFSGGQRQRISIARALALDPRLVILDEPTSALDVSVQSQVLSLLADLQQRHHLTYVFVSHNLAVVGEVADRVAVMRDGAIVEIGDTEQVMQDPRHDYTRMLLDAVPEPDPRRSRRRRATGQRAQGTVA